jgi:simple sugar transport system permease protein
VEGRARQGDSSLRKALIRPELGAIVGTIAVFAFFIALASDSGMFTAQGVLNWSTVSAQFMIIAVGACMLMIAGEFDLGRLHDRLRRHVDRDHVRHPAMARLDRDPPDLRHLYRHRRAQRLIVVRTGLPSFIVTLAFLFILRGFTIYLPQLIERKTIIGGISARRRATGSRRSSAARSEGRSSSGLPSAG